MTAAVRPDDEDQPMIWVRSTINLRGFPVGSERIVNPEEPYVKMCLKRGYLVPVEDQ